MNLQINRNHALAAAAFGATLLFANLSASPAFAAGLGVGANVGVGVGVGANEAGANMGGQSDAHIGAQGSLNSNGPNATDRDFGQARAEDRMSAQGALHSKARGKTHGDVDTDLDSSTSLATHAGR